ncbi:MAG TPA: DNA polymerase ligase N-terminal domain-containing protein [Planctomycetaceae bacterium]|nr:DNA polymerase ligase N-terminal domain-containing protein [Planctomycetaceae bacterium]
MPRFVVLTHDHPVLHWDFMLEHDGALRTWRLMQPPDGDGPIDAEALPDHRLAYLDSEGPVSGGRGTVVRWDAGTYEIVESAVDRLVVRLAGRKLCGAASLEQTESGPAWLFQRLHPSVAPRHSDES